MPDYEVNPAGAANDTGDQPDQGGEPPARNQVYIEVAQTWSASDDDWTHYPELIPIRCQRNSLSMGYSELEFEHYYGRVKQTYEEDLQTVAKFTPISGQWVRLRVVLDMEPVTIFAGQIYAPVEEVAGAANAASLPHGRQRWLAYGPEWYLERARIDTTWWRNPSGDDVLLDWLGSVNVRNDDDGVVGNRTATRGPSGQFTFGGTTEWTALSLLESFLYFYITSVLTGPDIIISIPAALVSYLSDLNANGVPKYSPRTDLRTVRNMRAFLMDVVSPARGLDATVVPTATGFEVRIYALLPDGIVFDGHEYPANTDVEELEVSERQELGASVEYSRVGLFDRIRVRGERIVSCFTLGGPGSGLSDLAGTLYRGWAPLDESLYKAGTGTAADTPEEHDAARTNPAYEDVFTKFVVSTVGASAFDFKAGAANIVFDDTFAPTQNATRYQLSDLRTLDRLPLLQGYDYSVDPPTVQTYTGTFTPEYRRPLALVYVEDKAIWADATKLNAIDRGRSNATIDTLDHGIGVRVRFSPQHWLAKGAWAGANKTAPPLVDPDNIAYDYERLVATVAVELDHRIGIYIEPPPELQSGDGSFGTLDIPGAHYWWLTPDTIVGVDEAGAVIRGPAAGTVLRDDRDLLRALAVGAIARYLNERVRATIRVQHTTELWDHLIGKMLRVLGDAGETDIQTPVSSVIWTFNDYVTTTLYCGQATK